jgi:DNA-directed RNA polymerase specialized sigma24 family protein
VRKENTSLNDVVTQLKMTNRLLVAQLKDRMIQQDLIKLLSTTGATHQEIADVLSTSAATVQVTMFRLKKKAKENSKGVQ